ncbi:ATP-binding cassette domain-containing protein [Novosphingobium resinovorum]|uniref:ATP-binding cassette domain-containing protein n=1 Tax=Novosphingobium TaxID=165696 RepID=UPI001B3C62FF|nr:MULTISPECIES: ATP-binding cassette domain-containing protein [Novosphingobium]MBF7011170.1 ATP-binding cassette domain-containing protein [Novosphingobium sp. HR1a]WJM29157.1 ATP-binding cassette domain-containing protein [Novosphingobium resinovorum]
MSFDVALTLKRGERRMDYAFVAGAGLTALFGPSGAGKTSLLDAVAGLLRPAEGRIAVAGATLFDSAARIDLRPEKRRCGYVFQDLRLFPHRSVRRNLEFGRREGSTLDRDHTLDLLGIAGLLDRMPATLSGGEAQRVAIGRALLSAPEFLLMDEPLASVDVARREDILRLIERIRDELRLPILYVSHDRAEVERLAQTIVPVAGPGIDAA